MLTSLPGTPPGSTLSYPTWGQWCCSILLNINCPALLLRIPNSHARANWGLMFQTQEKFRKHSSVGKTAWFISYSHSLYSSLHSWKPCQRLSYAAAAFSTIHKLGRWQGGLPRSECQKPGNQPFFLLLISLSPAPLHPGPPLPFPAGKISCLFMGFMTAGLPRSSKKKWKEGRRPLTKIPSELMLSFGN